ncbi:MAG: hypothetical protein IJC15_03555 [Clostridia bacterium]|nr:hypothetical protein [Clostridia bacterium]
MDNEQIPDLSAMLNSVLQNPEQMAQLQEMASSLGLTVPAPAEETADAAPPPPAENRSQPKARPDKRTALLMALRPYLNDNRREMIDAIVNFSRLGSMLGGGKES